MSNVGAEDLLSKHACALKYSALTDVRGAFEREKPNAREGPTHRLPNRFDGIPASRSTGPILQSSDIC
jgi:hypothetical protein